MSSRTSSEELPVILQLPLVRLKLLSSIWRQFLRNVSEITLNYKIWRHYTCVCSTETRSNASPPTFLFQPPPMSHKCQQSVNLNPSTIVQDKIYKKEGWWFCEGGQRSIPKSVQAKQTNSSFEDRRLSGKQSQCVGTQRNPLTVCSEWLPSCWLP
jgi:hypothetical protein